MSDQCAVAPSRTPLIPKTNPSSRPSASKAPEATPPTCCETIRIVAGTTSRKSWPQMSRCSATHESYSARVSSGLIVVWS